MDREDSAWSSMNDPPSKHVKTAQRSDELYDNNVGWNAPLGVAACIRTAADGR